jgi:2-polyprenyl-3-methyl-5-hydroxy-6-metoxy-1,4-benzoquinol methylase
LAFVYDTTVDPNADNNAHAYALGMIGYNKSVLEVGCATGYISKVMTERGCNVTGIELDAEAASVAQKWLERVVVGNIDEGSVWEEIEDDSVDAVIFGDVLEHLRDPLGALRAAVRKLKPSGIVVTSLPNVAHGDVRLSLLQGNFNYGETGLLDKTHIRFFTLESIRELLREAGLVVVETERVFIPLFQTELGIKREDVLQATINELLDDPEVESYQYVMKSVRDNGTRTLNELARRVNELSDHVRHEVVRNALRDRGLGYMVGDEEDVMRLQRHIQALESHASGLQANVDALDNELIASNARYQAVLSMRTVQATAPIRWLYRKVKRSA